MKISIVTISYNQAPFLKQAIESVISQDYEDIEYIVVDPGSTDGSREIIESYADRIHKIIFEPDQGPADGLNKGFSSATGDIFYYLNSDDVALPGAFSKVADYFEQFESVDVIYGHGLLINEANRVLRRSFSRKWSLKFCFGRYKVLQQATFIRRRAFETVGGFNHFNTSCWDYELLVDIALAGGVFRRIPFVLGAFRMHKESITSSGRLHDRIMIDTRRIAERILGRPLTVGDSLSYVCQKVMSRIVEPHILVAHLNDIIKYQLGLPLRDLDNRHH